MTEHEDASPVEQEAGPAPTGESTTPSAATLPAAMLGGEISPELAILLKKIQAFETLVKARRFERAAMVADDIQSAVENFDPRKYFPTLFAEFYADLVTNFDQISSFWARRDSVLTGRSSNSSTMSTSTPL